ncbi:MAG TPA: putative glycolipid-binding domain-containing protein [Pyrinomonadaceae bacterium]|jgi:hypothetical protein
MLGDINKARIRTQAVQHGIDFQVDHAGKRLGHSAVYQPPFALPIRRMNIAVGHKAKVRTAWLRFSSFNLEPLEQVYRRTETSKYRYESDGGRLVAELEVNDARLVTDYPGFWRVELV